MISTGPHSCLCSQLLGQLLGQLAGGPGFPFMWLPIIQRVAQSHSPGSLKAFCITREDKSERAYTFDLPLALHLLLSTGQTQAQNHPRFKSGGEKETLPLERSFLQYTTVSTHILLIPKPTVCLSWICLASDLILTPPPHLLCSVSHGQ